MLVVINQISLALASNDIQVPPPTQPPQLVFACELATEPLQVLFSDPEVIMALSDLHAGVAISLIDLSQGRATVVRRLNQAGVPVTAWMALPKEQGYYLNADNEPQAVVRFADFQKWTAQNNLRWSAIGLDVEPNIQELGALRTGHKLRLAGTLIGRYFNLRRVFRAREAYAGLILQMQSAGYLVETYQFPFIADERKANSTLLERLFGIVDVRGNREVLMLYTSFNHTMDSAIIWKYGPEAQVVAVGSTESDPKSDAEFPPLGWDEFSRDLIVASHFSGTVGVYSLEGCVHRGFLPRLKSMTWNQTVAIPGDAMAKANRMRSRIQTALWIASNLPYFILASFFFATSLVWRRRARRRLAAMGRG